MEQDITFEAVESLSLANSYGTIKKEKDINLHVSIKIKNGKGGFEVYDTKTGGLDWYGEGGLWFKGKYLVDYDGVFSLPKCVESKLIELGYSLDNL